jgi:truncated hemoglobin YjbI
MSQDSPLLQHLGSPRAMKVLTELLYEKLLKDDRLIGLFVGCDVEELMLHQNQFLTFCFSEFPLDSDVVEVICQQHERFFERGLNEHHFDIVVEYLVETLHDLRLKRLLIEQVNFALSKLRVVFEDGAALHGSGEVYNEEEEEEDEEYLENINQELEFLRNRLALL